MQISLNALYFLVAKVVAFKGQHSVTILPSTAGEVTQSYWYLSKIFNI